MKNYYNLLMLIAIVFLVSGLAIARAGGGQSYGGGSSYSEGTGSIETGGLGILLVISLLALIISLVTVISYWKIFEKAGQPGWTSVIPVYNTIVLLKISQKPEWWVILYFIPLVNTVIHIIVSIALAECFQKDTGFALGIILIPLVFYPILAFGDSQYMV